MQRYRCQADESRVGDITHPSKLGTLRNALVLCCCPDLSAVVQDDEGGRDLRTQPGVLTPGMRQLTNRPEGVGDSPGKRKNVLDISHFYFGYGLASFLWRTYGPYGTAH
jgi:hypothetical protein